MLLHYFHEKQNSAQNIGLRKTAADNINRVAIHMKLLNSLQRLDVSNVSIRQNDNEAIIQLVTLD